MNCECASRASIIFGILLTLVGVLLFYIYSPPNEAVYTKQSISQFEASTLNKHGLAYEYKIRRSVSAVFAVLGVIFIGFGISKKRSSACVKKCPACNKLVKPESKSCRHCDNNFSES